MASATAVKFTPNDTSILQALFDPEGALSENVQILPPATEPESQPLSWLEVEERLAIRLLNKETPTPAEIHEAISKLSTIISHDSHYASAYNNRAQATRLLFPISAFAHHPSELRSIITDLTMAISCATPATPTAIPSSQASAVLSSAHTHRGYLLWLGSRPQTPEGVLAGIDGLRDLSKEKLEEFANRDFSVGGRYGNAAARQLAVWTNPYAKLCGSIVKEALRKEVTEFHGASAVL